MSFLGEMVPGDADNSIWLFKWDIWKSNKKKTTEPQKANVDVEVYKGNKNYDIKGKK